MCAWFIVDIYTRFLVLKVSKFQSEFMKSSFLPRYEQKISGFLLCVGSEGRNLNNFLFIFWKKRWLHKFILKFTDLYFTKFVLYAFKKSKQQQVVDPRCQRKAAENFGTVQCILLLLVRWNFAQLTVCFQLLLFRQQSSWEDGKVNMTQ